MVTYEFRYFNGDTYEVSQPTLEDCLREVKMKRNKHKLDRVSRGVTTLPEWYTILSVTMVSYITTPSGVARETKG